MSKEQKINILTGDDAKENLNDPTLTQLVNRVNKIERNETIGHICHKAVMGIYTLFGANKITSAVQTKMDRAFEPIEHMKILRELGHIVVAKDGEKSVGMAGFQLCGKDPRSGKNVYVLRRFAVKQEYEGKMLALRMGRSIVERVHKLDPEALLIVEAQHPAVSKICLWKGFKKVSLEKGLMIQYGSQEAVDAMLPYFQKNGGEFFVYDLSAKVESDKD